MINYNELKVLAIEAKVSVRPCEGKTCTCNDSPRAMNKFHKRATPDVILALLENDLKAREAHRGLLDELDELRKELDRTLPWEGLCNTATEALGVVSAERDELLLRVAELHDGPSHYERYDGMGDDNE